MAVDTKRHPVFNVQPKFRVCGKWPNMMGLKVRSLAALSACVSISPKHSQAPVPKIIANSCASIAFGNASTPRRAQFPASGSRARSAAIGRCSSDSFSKRGAASQAVSGTRTNGPARFGAEFRSVRPEWVDFKFLIAHRAGKNGLRFLCRHARNIACSNACFETINPAYVDIAVTRWQQFTGQTATLEGDGRTFAEIAAERVKEAA